MCVNNPDVFGRMKVDALYSNNSGANVRPFGFLMQLDAFYDPIPLNGLLGFTTFIFMPNQASTVANTVLAIDWFNAIDDLC